MGKYKREKERQRCAPARYQCARCDAIFASPKGPEIFCEHCRNYLAAWESSADEGK